MVKYIVIETNYINYLMNSGPLYVNIYIYNNCYVIKPDNVIKILIYIIKICASMYLLINLYRLLIYFSLEKSILYKYYIIIGTLSY